MISLRTRSDPGREADVAVVSVVEDTRDARFHRILAALDAVGVSTCALGVGDPTHLPTDSLAEISQPLGMMERLRTALRVLSTVDTPVVMTLDPVTALAAAATTRLKGQRLVVDVHEDYAAVAADRAWASGWHAPLVRAAVMLFTEVAAHADLTVVADDHVPPVEARNRLVVRNLPPAGSLPAPGERDSSPRAIYVGALSASRGLDTMVDVLSGAPDWRLDLVGSLGDRTPEAFSRQVRDAGVADRLTWHGRLPQREAWERARGAWVGLCLLHDTPAYRVAMPTKVYEYATLGIPIMASPIGRLAAVVGGAGIGAVATSAADGARILQEWGVAPAPLDDLAAAARSWATVTMTDRPFDRLAAEVRALVDE